MYVLYTVRYVQTYSIRYSSMHFNMNKLESLVSIHRTIVRQCHIERLSLSYLRYSHSSSKRLYSIAVRQHSCAWHTSLWYLL